MKGVYIAGKLKPCRGDIAIFLAGSRAKRIKRDIFTKGYKL